MELRPTVQHTTARDLHIGHLAEIWQGAERYLILRFGDDAVGERYFLFIPRSGEMGPMVMPQGPIWDPQALSYGDGWILRFELEDSSKPGDRERYAVPGVLNVGLDGPILNCRNGNPNNWGEDYVFFNISALSTADFPGQAWPTEKWSIWLPGALTGNREDQLLYQHSPVVR